MRELGQNQAKARTDDGPGVMAVGIDEGLVLFDLGRTTRIVRLKPDQALRMAEALYYHAILLATGKPPPSGGVG
jgi:aminoglycoside/choline kinase family phosphotransferase